MSETSEVANHMTSVSGYGQRGQLLWIEYMKPGDPITLSSIPGPVDRVQRATKIIASFPLVILKDRGVERG